VHSAVEFNKQMTFLKTQAGASGKEVRTMTSDILKMKDMQFAPVTLAKGLYYIESAGLRGAKALQGLQVAARAPPSATPTSRTRRRPWSAPS